MNHKMETSHGQLFRLIINSYGEKNLSFAWKLKARILLLHQWMERGIMFSSDGNSMLTSTLSRCQWPWPMSTGLSIETALLFQFSGHATCQLKA